MTKKTKSRARARRERPLRLFMFANLALQFSACLLLVSSDEGIDLVAATMAFSLPALSYFFIGPLPRLLRADRLLVMITDFLCGLGVVVLYALSPELGLRHAVHFALGIGVFAACALCVRRFRRFKLLCLLLAPVSLVLLALPVLIGREINGAKNWISIAGVASFQPSEVTKLALVFVLAQSFSTLRGLKGMVPGIAFAAACLGALMLQKDLGTALLYYLVTLLMFWAASSNVLLTGVGLLGGAGAAVLGYQLFAHVRTRIAHLAQSLVGCAGKGLSDCSGADGDCKRRLFRRRAWPRGKPRHPRLLHRLYFCRPLRADGHSGGHCGAAALCGARTARRAACACVAHGVLRHPGHERDGVSGLANVCDNWRRDQADPADGRDAAVYELGRQFDAQLYGACGHPLRRVCRHARRAGRR